MKRTTFALAAVLCGFGLAATGCAVEAGEDTGTSQSAITDGQPDGDAHPGVVLLLVDACYEYDANHECVVTGPAWRCSATLLSPTVVLTAGHCTEGATGGRIFLGPDVQGDPRYPWGEGDAEAASMNTYPGYFTGPWFANDVGVVVLEGDGVPDTVVPPSAYGQLPGLNQLDALKPRKSTTFTAVGYGMQKSFPDAASWKDQAVKVRMNASPNLVQINGGIVGDFSLLLSNNASAGGTCFGDSGGPNFLGTSNVVAGVTSFGMNGTCAGTGGVFRMDRADVLEFVNSFLD